MAEKAKAHPNEGKMRRVCIWAMVDATWNEQDLLHEANDALVKHDVVMYVEDLIMDATVQDIPE